MIIRHAGSRRLHEHINFIFAAKISTNRRRQIIGPLMKEAAIISLISFIFDDFAIEFYAMKSDMIIFNTFRFGPAIQ